MESEPTRIIGAGVHNLARASAYYASLVHEVPAHTDVVTHLDNQVGEALGRLEAVLEGYDSFDTLSFLRTAMGPFDFTGLKESETQIETSQAVQDVIGLALLGMGLPRQPLTGVNSGQPDIGAARTHATTIIRAANTLAVIQGNRLDEPLGPLAGEFLAYEQTVRGRQYDSVAMQLNTGVLGSKAVDAILSSTLGFTLTQVRAVREAALELLNERFFGARDRVGDAARTPGGVDRLDRDAFLADMNLMVNECRLFGSVTPDDIISRTDVDLCTTQSILDFFSIGRPDDVAPNPVREFVDGQIPAPWGSIADDDGYLMLNGFLGEDEMRRNIERGLNLAGQRGGPAAKAWAKYVRHRASFSETGAGAALAGLLGGTAPKWEGQKYLGPEDLRNVSEFTSDSDPTNLPGRTYESDILLLVDDVAFCVEVKAGTVTDKARGGHAKRLATDLEKTLTEANEQAQRLAELIRANGGVWSADGDWIDLSSTTEIHSIIVMLDDMGPLSLSMNELAEKKIIASVEVPWIVSLHDLLVTAKVLNHPAQFLDFVRRRRGRKLATMLSGADELDVLMWFITGGMYFDPDPADVADQLPINRPANPADQRRFNEQKRVHLGTLTDDLDAWMYGEEGHSQVASPKPVRQEESWVEQYLEASEASMTPGWLRFGADLVGLSGRAQQKIGRDLKSRCRAAQKGTIERSLTTHGTTSFGSWLLTAVALPEGAEADHLTHYVDDKQYQTHSSRSMLLLYRPDGSLVGSRFRGAPEPRSAQRDAAIEISPLRSLAATFSSPPPSAKRATRQLRGKGNNRKRR